MFRLEKWTQVRLFRYFFFLLSAWKRELYLTAMAINIIILLSGPRCIPCCRFNFQFFFLNQFLSSFIIVIVHDVILRYKLLHYVCVCLSFCLYLSLTLSQSLRQHLPIFTSLTFFLYIFRLPHSYGHSLLS